MLKKVEFVTYRSFHQSNTVLLLSGSVCRKTLNRTLGQSKIQKSPALSWQDKRKLESKRFHRQNYKMMRRFSSFAREGSRRFDVSVYTISL